MTTTQQHQYKMMKKAFDHRHGIGSWDKAAPSVRQEYAEMYMDGYNELQRWAPLAALASSTSAAPAGKAKRHDESLQFLADQAQELDMGYGQSAAIGAGELPLLSDEPWNAPANWNALYMTINHLMAKIGAYGSADSDSNEVNAVMNALHEIDGGVVSKRAQDLHEKASMPLFQATKLAVKECGAIYEPVAARAPADQEGTTE